MEITVAIGVRPHYVKASGLQYVLRDAGISLKFLDLHQHYDKCLRDIYVNEGNLQVACKSKPIRSTESDLEELTRQIMDVNQWFVSEAGKGSRALIVFGDATPAYSASIAANRLSVPIIHIEAGVRRVTSEKEHWNSLITDQLSSLRYCYTLKNVTDLQREGLGNGSYLVGDLLAEWTIKEVNRDSLPIMLDNYILVSIHRPQNCKSSIFRIICEVLKKENKPVVWIMHPRTNIFMPIVEEEKNFYLLPSQKHSDMLALVDGAEFILTDSGGLVREGVLLGKKVIVCHEQGMWIDLVQSGAILRADQDKDSIEKAVKYVKEHELPSGKKHFMVDGGVELFRKTLFDFLYALEG